MKSVKTIGTKSLVGKKTDVIEGETLVRKSTQIGIAHKLSTGARRHAFFFFLLLLSF